MDKQKQARKAKRKIIILRILGCILIFFQLVGYLNNPSDRTVDNDAAGKIGYFLGYNIFLWIALFLFYRSWTIAKKNKRKEKADTIESIGNGE